MPLIRCGEAPIEILAEELSQEDLVIVMAAREMRERVQRGQSREVHSTRNAILNTHIGRQAVLAEAETVH